MHMADALLSPAVGGTMIAASAAALAYSVVRVRKTELDDKKIPMMGVMGAFVFAAQMINFTIPVTGSSGHIGGGILLAALLGPFPALLTLAAVLIIQCLLFADGGLLALGCNIFNMGVLPCLLVYPLLFKPILKGGVNKKRLSIACVLSVVIGLQLGAFGVVVETSASGITQLPFGSFLLLMQPIHLAIGLVEGLVTAAVVCFVQSVRPEILDCALTGEKLPGVSVKKVAGVLLAGAIVLGGGVSLLASAYPDGLEWSIESITGSTEVDADGGVHEAAALAQEKTAVLPDYGFKSGENAELGTSVSGIVGGAVTLVLAGAAGFVISLVKRRNKSAK